MVRLRLGNRVRLLPALSAREMAGLLRSALITLSVTEHDGTPNSLLEAMACGSFPIAGDLESIREWIVDQENGLLVSPSDPEQLAEAIFLALGDEALRKHSAVQNRRIIDERADWVEVMPRAESFYERVLQFSSHAGRGGTP
jgi:glycosyltransferase involved in cell wall biosynthesis